MTTKTVRDVLNACFDDYAECIYDGDRDKALADIRVEMPSVEEIDAKILEHSGSINAATSIRNLILSKLQ